ncbi:MAG TPA: phosphonate C-P lyase system protein PhnG [Spirochaetia bacterium]|nr:phosphonate C-P lyase system protein PhnG [Spirochaetia bacterium]
MMDYSEIAAEAGPEAVRAIAETIANRAAVRILKAPTPGMVMVKQVDPLENVPFLLGEAFVTECEVDVDGCLGYGCVLGTGDDRALCSALLDAVIGGGHSAAAQIVPLLEAEESRIKARWEKESRAAATTRVSFDVR